MGLGLRFIDNAIINPPVVVVRVDRVMSYTIFISAILDTHQRLVSNIIGIHNERVARVESVHFKRRLVFLGRFIGKNQTICRSANHLPFDNLLVLRSFVLCEHKIVQSRYISCDSFISTASDVLNRFSAEITDFEGDNLIRSVFHNLVTDFRANFFNTIENRLLTTIVVPQIFNLTSIQRVSVHSIRQNINHVVPRDSSHAGLDNTSSVHLTSLARSLGSINFVCHDCSSFPKIKDSA